MLNSHLLLRDLEIFTTFISKIICQANKILIFMHLYLKLLVQRTSDDAVNCRVVSNVFSCTAASAGNWIQECFLLWCSVWLLWWCAARQLQGSSCGQQMAKRSKPQDAHIFHPAVVQFFSSSTVISSVPLPLILSRTAVYLPDLDIWLLHHYK